MTIDSANFCRRTYDVINIHTLATLISICIIESNIWLSQLRDSTGNIPVVVPGQTEGTVKEMVWPRGETTHSGGSRQAVVAHRDL